MNPENWGIRPGGLNRSDGPSSGHLSASNELPAKLVTEIAAMDYEMKTLDIKIKSKKEEEKRLIEQRNSSLSTLSSMRKQLTLLQERERSFANSLNRVKDSNTALEGLELAVIQNLKAIKISNNEQKVKSDDVIKKYSTIINLHQESFTALPWVREKILLSIGVEKKQVLLGRLKMKQQENKAKFRLLEQISEKRQRTEILRLSVLMIGREKSFMDGHEKGAKKRTMEQEIRTLEQHKCVIQEQIASRTQEMVLRIMNRSGDRSQKPSAPDAARPKTETHELRTSILKNEMNKSAVALSVKDRLGIGKRQDTVSSAALSIRDRLGISKKQLNVILTPSIPSLICEDRAKESNTSLAPSAKDDLTEFARETIARRSSSPRDAAESLETCSNGISVASEEVAQNNETCNELLAQTSLSPPPLVMLNADPGFTEGTTVIPSRPPPLKAILKPPSSLTNQSEMSMRKDIPSPIFTSPSRFEDERSLIVNTTTDSHSAAFQPSVTQSTAVHPEHVSSGVNVDGERTRDSHLQPDDEGSENVTDAPAPKKPRVSQMPPPRPIPASQRQQTAKRPNQPPKRVSFMPNKEETREKEPRLGKGLNTQQATLSNAATQPAVEVEMESGESSQKQTEPAVSDFVEPVDVPVNRESTPKLPSTSQKENQACQSTADEFRHLFSPSPQMFSAPQQQATPGNFDSIFGAIFNTPDSSKDSAGFQFNLQGDTQKPNSTSTDTTNPSSSTGQDFFSFFGTPSNANETKKSYTDNFFKLF